MMARARADARQVCCRTVVSSKDTYMTVAWLNFRLQAHKRDEIVSAVDELKERMRRTSGCTQARLFANSDDPLALTLTSEWATSDEAAAFFSSRDFQVFRGIRILLRGEPLIVFDEVQTRVTRLFR